MRSLRFSVTLPLALAALAGCSPDRTGDTPSEPDETAPTAARVAEAEAADVSPARQPGTSASAEELAEDEETIRDAQTQATVPARFQGTFGENRAACDERSHGNFTITDDEIRFFESRGKVRSVRVDGDYAAATVDETYVETTRYIFYMALEGADKLRFRYDKNERYTYVRCP